MIWAECSCYDGFIEDDTACGDPDHCSPWRICPDCEGDGGWWE